MRPWPTPSSAGWNGAWSGGSLSRWPAWPASSSAGSTRPWTNCWKRRQQARRKPAAGAPEAGRERILGLCGKVAVANARQAYRRFQRIFSGQRWERLAAAGARVQRLLWASTGTKNPHYSDILYVDELIGRDTVNTMPPATADAFRDHGTPRNSLTGNLDEADAVFEQLTSAGISLSAVTDRLLAEGVDLFEDAFQKLIAAIPKVRAEGRPAVSDQQLLLPGAMRAAVDQALEEWDRAASSRKLWSRDASLWTNRDEGVWLAWLGIVDD
ncbi:MAG: hypothetical protein NTY38_13110, partial [Acidobacteria bacterium]|nr:hypothetical protein [Acidobacteriota bacterium]